MTTPLSSAPGFNGMLCVREALILCLHQPTKEL